MKHFFGLILILALGSMAVSAAQESEKVQDRLDQCERYEANINDFKTLLRRDQRRIRNGLDQLKLHMAHQTEDDANFIKLLIEDRENHQRLKQIIKQADAASDVVAVPACVIGGSGLMFLTLKKFGKYFAKKTALKTVRRTDGFGELLGVFGLPIAFFGSGMAICTTLDKRAAQKQACANPAEDDEQLWDQLGTEDGPDEQCVRMIDFPQGTIPLEKDEQGKIKLAEPVKVMNDYRNNLLDLNRIYLSKLRACKTPEQKDQVWLDYYVRWGRLVRDNLEMLGLLDFCVHDDDIKLLARTILIDEQKNEMMLMIGGALTLTIRQTQRTDGSLDSDRNDPSLKGLPPDTSDAAASNNKAMHAN